MIPPGNIGDVVELFKILSQGCIRVESLHRSVLLSEQTQPYRDATMEYSHPYIRLVRSSFMPIMILHATWKESLFRVQYAKTER